jgi:enamine deaminase RidA (YjgF/YER057c/UK114 family)
MDKLNPPGWAQLVGYSNGIAVGAGRIVFIASQVGWDAQQKFHSEEIVPQFEQALRNVVAMLVQAGGRPGHICKLTACCCDRAAYLAARPALGAIWRRLMGQRHAAMSMTLRRTCSAARRSSNSRRRRTCQGCHSTHRLTIQIVRWANAA